MLFRSLAALFSGVLLAQGALAQLTQVQVINNIKIVTSVSGNLNDVLGGLTTATGHGDVTTMCHVMTIISRFRNFDLTLLCLDGCHRFFHYC